jgi:hypothetical protein
MTHAAEGASRALVNISGDENLRQPMKDDVFLCLCAGLRVPVTFDLLFFLSKRRPAPSHSCSGLQHPCKSFSCALAI